MKFRTTTIRIVAALAIVLLIFMALPAGSASAAITQQQSWSNVYAGTGFPGTYSYTVAAGANRMLVVGVSSSITAAATQTATVTYGGQSMTQQVGDGTTSSMTHTYLFYLQDAGILNASSQDLVITVSGGTSRYNYVYAAVYAGVDQSATPITNSRNRNRTAQSATVGPFTTALTIGGGDRAVEIANLTTNITTARTINTWAANWSSALGPNSAVSNGWSFSAYAATDSTAGTTTSSHTASGTCYSSISAMSIKSFVAPPTPTATATSTSTSTPTVTLTPTLTPTFTITHTPLPLAGATFVRFSAMLLNAPDYSLDAQTVSGRIGGGVGPFTVVVHIISPDKTVGNNGELIFTPPVQLDDTFLLDASITGNVNFGCDYQGIWQAYFEISDSDGHNATSTTITWAVSFPRVHAIP